MDFLVPSAPKNVEVVQVNSTAYRVLWNPPEHSNGQIFGYYVYQDKLQNGVPLPNGRKMSSMIMNKDVTLKLLDHLILF